MNEANKQILDQFCYLLTLERKSPVTINYYRVFALGYLEFCEETNREISEFTALEYLNVKEKYTKSENTLKTYKFCMITFLRYHLKKESDQIKLHYKIKPMPYKPVYWFDTGTLYRMLKDSSGHYKHNAYLRTLIATMCRREEIHSLLKSDLKIVKEKNEQGEEKIYYVICINDQKGLYDRELVVDSITWAKLNDLAREPNERLFKFSSRMCNYIVDKYRPVGVKGSLHAIRHGVRRFIEAKKMLRSDDHAEEYYLGHKIGKTVEDMYSTLIFKPDKTINYEFLFDFYRNYNPIMVYAY